MYQMKMHNTKTGSDYVLTISEKDKNNYRFKNVNGNDYVVEHKDATGKWHNSGSYSAGDSTKTDKWTKTTRNTIAKGGGLKSYDTGGYTGEWNDKSGKLAFLHQKELVLNQKDTKNTLAAVKIASGIINSVAGLGSNILNNLIAGREISNILTNNNRNADNSVQQKVEISATFPSVQSSQEIEKAFNNLVNAASQRAAGNRRTY